MVADALRRQADQFIDLKDLQSKIGRNPLPELRRNDLQFLPSSGSRAGREAFDGEVIEEPNG
jgi:hypothetical protein